MVNEFERRFARHRDELEWLFMELHDDRDALHRFEAMMREMWACREEELRALDRAREANPHWYRGANMLGMRPAKYAALDSSVGFPHRDC